MHKTFKGIAQRGKCSMGWFFGFKLHLKCNEKGELLRVVNNNTPTDDKNYLELDLLSDLVADYEEEYYPIAAPTLVETLKLRMYEIGHQVAGHILHTVATTEVDACQ